MIRSEWAADAEYFPTPPLHIFTRRSELENAHRCALEDLDVAERAMKAARHHLRLANRAKPAGFIPRKQQQAQALRAINRARAALRRAEVAALAALDALAADRLSDATPTLAIAAE